MATTCSSSSASRTTSTAPRRASRAWGRGRRGTIMKSTLGIVAATLGLLCTAPVLAHHGFDTEYDAKKKAKLEGVVKQVAWPNPHMRVYIDVTGPDGKVVNWNLELTSPNRIRRQGWGPNDLLPGEKVVFEGDGGEGGGRR